MGLKIGIPVIFDNEPYKIEDITGIYYWIRGESKELKCTSKDKLEVDKFELFKERIESIKNNGTK